jgi:DNA adenine methylase
MLRTAAASLIEHPAEYQCDPSRLQPLVKWAGGKEQELKYILPSLPDSFVNYYEPFVGGGAVYTAVQANYYFINDKSGELIGLYRVIASQERNLFFQALDEITHNWDVIGRITSSNRRFFLDLYKRYSSGRISENILTNNLYEFILQHADQFNGMFSALFNFDIENFIHEIKINLIRKTKRMKVLEAQKHKLPDGDILDNIETALKSAFYMHFRHLYNSGNKYHLSNAFSAAIFLFIRNFAYSGMFRYNAKGEFNVPYGGIGYNRKNFSKKINFLRSDDLLRHLQNTTIDCVDFVDFFQRHTPNSDDFIFLDPPYDSEFSTYTQNEFTRDDQRRLADYLLNSTSAKWMLIIKNTRFILDLYNKKGLNIDAFDKTYLVSFMNRNNKEAEHLLIKNY